MKVRESVEVRFAQLLFLVCAIGGLVAIAATGGFAQTGVLTHVRQQWHNAGIAEADQQWTVAHAIYDTLQDEVTPLPLAMREWYRGTAYYGAAICDAAQHDTLQARTDFGHANEHHFWNFELVRSMPFLANTLGAHWLDSSQAYWLKAREIESRYWQTQSPIVIRPEPLDSAARYPVIIALHGGNACFEEFAAYWKQIADSLHVIAIVPPGIFRESQVTNSWGDSITLINKYLVSLVGEIKRFGVGDTSMIYVAGFSQGAQAATSFCLNHPELVRGAVAICGFAFHLPPAAQLKTAALQHAQLYAITASRDQTNFHNSESALESACIQNGIRYYGTSPIGSVHEMPLNFYPLLRNAWKWLNAERSSAE